MPGNNTLTRRNENRAIRQNALREQLAAGGHLQHAVEILEQVDEVEDPLELKKLEFKFKGRMQLVNKYLGDVKQVTVSGDADNPLVVTQMIFGKEKVIEGEHEAA